MEIGEAKQMDFYTIEDIYELPEGQRAELMDGQLYMMASPGTKHQEIVSDLHYPIKDHIKKHQGECKVYTAPFAVFLNADNETYLEPDISVVCHKNRITEKGCYGAPDWIIEGLFHLPAVLWIIIKNYSNTVPPESGNTGSQIMTGIGSRCIILNRMQWKSMTFRIKSGLVFSKV